MRHWWIAIVCAAGLGCPVLATEPQAEEKSDGDLAMEVAEKIGGDLVQLARELNAAVEAGEITREEADARMIEASMRQIAEQNKRFENERKQRINQERMFDPEASRVKFEAWLDVLAAGADRDGDTWPEFSRLHNDQSFARTFGQEDVGQLLGITLAHTIQTDPRFAPSKQARRSALMALCIVDLSEAELRDRTVRELLLSQIERGGQAANYVIMRSLASVPKEDRVLWYTPLTNHLRSERYERFIIGCEGIRALGAIAGNDQKFLLEIITDLRSASKPLADTTYLDPFERSLMPIQFWPRSQVRAAAASAVLATATDPHRVLDELEDITGRARLDIASGIAATFCGFDPVDTPVWDKGATERAFALLDGILAEPTSKAIVVDPAAAFWADMDFRRFGTSILTDLTMGLEFMDNKEVTQLAMRSALRAAHHHGDDELIESVTDMARRFAPGVVDEVRREPSTIDAGTELVKLAVELRAAVERGEITQEEMSRRLEEAAYERIRTP